MPLGCPIGRNFIKSGKPSLKKPIAEIRRQLGVEDLASRFMNVVTDAVKIDRFNSISINFKGNVRGAPILLATRLPDASDIEYMDLTRFPREGGPGDVEHAVPDDVPIPIFGVEMVDQMGMSEKTDMQTMILHRTHSGRGDEFIYEIWKIGFSRITTMGENQSVFTDLLDMRHLLRRQPVDGFPGYVPARVVDRYGGQLTHSGTTGPHHFQVVVSHDGYFAILAHEFSAIFRIGSVADGISETYDA